MTGAGLPLRKQALLWIVALIISLGEGGFADLLRNANESAFGSMSIQNLPPYFIGLGSVALIILYVAQHGSFRGTLPVFVAAVLPLLLIPIWGVDKYQQFRLVLAFSGYLFACVAFSLWLTSEELLEAIVRSMLIGTISSVAVALLLPSIGVHSSEDMSGSLFGAWRGIFGHKNEFGEFNDLVIITVAVLGLRLFRPLAIPGLLLLLAFISILRSHSSGAIIGVVLTFVLASAAWSGGGPIYFRMARLPSRVLVLLSPALAAVIAPIVILLGRDLTFTGRTFIWSAVWDALPGVNIIGRGPAYFGLELYPKLVLSFGDAFTDPHNGYLDALLSYGTAGLAFTIAIAAMGIQSARRLMRGGSEADVLLGRVALVSIIYMLCSSLDESTLVRGGYPPPFMGWFMACAAMSALKRPRDVASPQPVVIEDGGGRPQWGAPGVR